MVRLLELTPARLMAMQNNYSSVASYTISGGNNIDFGKTRQQLKSPSTYSDTSVWDFVNLWMFSGNVNEGFPFIKGNNEMDDFTFILTFITMFLTQALLVHLLFQHLFTAELEHSPCKPQMYWLVFMILMEQFLLQAQIL